MNEEEWQTCSDPMRLLSHFRGRLRNYSRKLRLFACACCRRIEDILPDERSRRAIAVAEQFADGLSSSEELTVANRSASSAHGEAFRAKGKLGATAEWAATHATDPLPFHAARTVQWMTIQARFHTSGSFVSGSQADLVRCIFGNPFRPAQIDPLWLTWNDATLKMMARGIYDDRAFDQLPILADALEDAGCTNEAILSHCRGPGPHTRGCWVVDLLLGLT